MFLSRDEGGVFVGLFARGAAATVWAMFLRAPNVHRFAIACVFALN